LEVLLLCCLLLVKGLNFRLELLQFPLVLLQVPVLGCYLLLLGAQFLFLLLRSDLQLSYLIKHLIILLLQRNYTLHFVAVLLFEDVDLYV
jgi:hypothetical protein